MIGIAQGSSGIFHKHKLSKQLANDFLFGFSFCHSHKSLRKEPMLADLIERREHSLQSQNHQNKCDHEFTSMSKDEAIERLMTQYGEEIKRLVYTYTKNWAQADDLTQDVFVQIYLKLDQFSGRSSIRTWIYSIAINKCRDFKRSWHFRNIQLYEKVLSFTRTDSKTPEFEVVQKDDKTYLMEQVLALPIKYREVILLFYYKDFSIEEISLVTGLNQGTIKTRLKRAREKLHNVLSENRGEKSE